MEEQSSSWIRRAKFSHTVYHRFDTTSKLPSGAYSRLSSFPSTHTVERNDLSVVKSRPRSTTSTNQSLGSSVNTQIPQAQVQKQRSLSPTPGVVLPETFKEARSNQQRYSTPCPRRNETEKKVISKLSRKDAQYKLKSQSLSSSNNLLRHFSGMRISDKSKNKKDSTWSKYFDRGGGKITALNTADELTVDLSKLFLGLRFASGAHSRLHHGIYKDQPVAVKIIRQPDDDENGIMAARLEKQFNREVTLLSHLHHENVIKLVAACRNPPVFCIITEYLAGGSLRKFLHKLEKKPVPLPKLIAIALDIARGMQYVHSQGVIHRDLKPENILFDEEFKLKVADFGIACEEAYCESLAEDPGTYRWMAPEMIKHKSYGRKVDVYSFGLVLWEMATGIIPYEEMTPIQAAYAVVNKNLRPGIPANCPPALKALIEQCWASNSDKRPDFWQIVKVLEQFESSVARDGTLNQVPKLISQDQKKGGLLHWIQKLGPANSNSTPMPKPKIF